MNSQLIQLITAMHVTSAPDMLQVDLQRVVHWRKLLCQYALQTLLHAAVPQVMSAARELLLCNACQCYRMPKLTRILITMFHCDAHCIKRAATKADQRQLHSDEMKAGL